MKKIIYTLIVLLLYVSCFGQEEDPNPDLPNLIPPSPVAYELGKYGQVPVGYFTGTPNVNVPVYNYQAGKLSVPISLSYNSNGIKVDQLASNVGLGWSLNCGGVVTRITKGKPDELSYQYFPEGQIQNTVDPLSMEYFKNAADGFMDTESDEYMYNFNGQSGKFIIGNEKEILKIPHNDLLIEMFGNTQGNGWKITTTEGIQYVFSDIETSEQFTSTRSGGIRPQNPPVTSSWYLSNIIHPSGDTITFNYEGTTYDYESSISQEQVRSYAGGGCNGGPDCYNGTSHTTHEFTTNIIGKRILEITSNVQSAGRVSFIYDQPHPSVSNYDLISEIKVQQSTSNPVESFSFEYITNNHDRIFLKDFYSNIPNKAYSFDYIDYTGLCERLSFDQDYFGYFNNAGNYYFLPEVDFYAFENSQWTGNRNPNNSFSQKGLLRRVTYPTKGYSEFNYEPNSYYGEQITYPPHEELSLRAITESDWQQITETRNTGNIYFNQDAIINASVIFNIYGSGCDSSQPFEPKGTFWIENDITGEWLTLYEYYGNTGWFPIGESVDIEEGQQREFKVTLEKDQNYNVNLKVIRPCTDAAATIHYYSGDTIVTVKNIETGGSRIEKIIHYDPVSDQEQVERYYYNNFENKNESSGDPGKKAIFISERFNTLQCAFGDGYKCLYYVLSSNSITPLFNSGNNNIYYEYVTVSYGGDNFENGGETHEFIINRDLPGNQRWGETGLIQNSSTWSNFGYNNGKERSILKFKVEDGVKIPVSFAENKYKNDERNFRESYFYKINKSYEEFLGFPMITHVCTQEDVGSTWIQRQCLNASQDHKHAYTEGGICVSSSGGGPNNQVWLVHHPCYEVGAGNTIEYPKSIENLNIVEYQNNSYWHYLNKTITTQYDENGENPIVSTTRYYYDNADHLQLTRTSKTTSTGDSLITISYYPDDVDSANSLPGGQLSGPEFDAVDRLKLNDLHRIAEPVQTEIYRNEQLLKRNRIKYKEWATVVMPEYMQQAKAGNPLEDRIVYHQYDDHGNPVELSKADDLDYTYLWGYNYSKVVAEIQNATYQEVLNSLSCSYTELQTKTEQELLSIFTALRNDMEASLITSFTYEPLKGMTTQTDPNGRVSYYEYDDYGRLVVVRDEDQHVIKKVEYNYLDPNKK